MAGTDGKVQILARSTLFGGLEPALLAQLASLAELRSFAAGAAIFRKGDAGGRLFVVRQGRVKISSGSSDGRDLALNILGPGTTFGEVAFADGGARTADAIAMEPTELLGLGRRELLPLLKRHPDIMLHMLAAFSGLVRWMAESVEDAAFLDLPARLAKRLVFLSRHFGIDLPTGRKLAVTLPHRELASHMNVTRESVTRLLAKWRDAGLIEERRGAIVLKDIERLTVMSLGGGAD